MSPKISVIMPCFNSANFISESIESILKQTFSDFELILIDDGSTDESLEIIRQYQQVDSRVVVVEKENTGPADSRNRGVFESKGEWIAILDSDDIAHHTRLEKQYKYVSQRQDIVMIGSGFTEINSNGDPIKCHYYPAAHSILVKRLQRLMAFPAHSSLMYRSEVVKRIGGFNARYLSSEDIDIWLRLAENGRIICLGDALVKVRKHANNVSNHEGGRKQALYGVTASVCHFLRNRGAIDPSVCDSVAYWCSFVEWVDLRIRQEGYFERQKDWSQLRLSYFSAHNRYAGAWRLVNGLIESKTIVQILTNKFFGSDLPATLADEWISKQKLMNSSEYHYV